MAGSLYGKSFRAPITLRASQMDVTFQPSVRLTLDLRSDGFVGSDAQTGYGLETRGLHWMCRGCLPVSRRSPICNRVI